MFEVKIKEISVYFKIIKLVLSYGDLFLVNKFLGRFYEVCGEVISD